MSKKARHDKPASHPDAQAPRVGAAGHAEATGQTQPREGHEHGGHREHAGHGGHAGHEQMFRRRFWVCLVLSLPVLLYSPTIRCPRLRVAAGSARASR